MIEMSEPTLMWSQETIVPDPDRPGSMMSIFQMGTYAIRAEWPDGTVKVRVLPSGTALTRRGLDEDEDFRRELIAAMATQTEPIVVGLP